MKPILILMIISLHLFLGACTSSDTDQTQQEFVIDDMIRSSAPITLQDMKAEMKFVKLKLKDSAFISQINKVVCTDSAIYVLTYNPIKILKFDDNGEFLKQISAPGRGEGEYTYANDLFFDKDAGRIYLIDIAGALLEFDQDGNFINKHPTREGLISTVMGNDGNMYESIQVLMGNEPSKLIVRSVKNDTIAVIPNHVKYQYTPLSAASYNDSKSLFVLNGDVVYHQMSTDTVFTYSPDNQNLKIRYYFTNPSPITAKVYEQLASKTKELTLVYDIAEDNNYIYVTIITPPWQKQLYLIDKITNQYYKANFEIGKEIGSSQSVAFYPKWQYNHKLVDYIDTGEGEPVVVILTYQ